MNKKQILIIDDEAANRRALSDFLTEGGYETTMAANGAEGLTVSRTRQFHAALVDLRMPHMDGLQVITALHAEQPELPIVVVSGTGILSDAVEAIRRGAWDYLTKPVLDVDEITVVVERVLEKAHLQAERDQSQRELEQLNRMLGAEVGRQTQDLRAQNRRLMALNRVSYAISDPLDIDTVFNRAIDAAMAAIEANGGVVWLLNPATKQLVVAVARGVPESSLASVQAIPLGQGIVGQVAQSGHPQSGGDFADAPWVTDSDETIELRSFLCVPLRAADKAASPPDADSQPDEEKKHPIVGAMGIAMRDEYDFDAHEVELLASIGNQVGVALARARITVDLKKANAQLAQANAELRRLDTLREQFIQNVTHELRTPLALAHGYIEMMVQGGLSPEEQQTALNVASRRVHALVELVESITTLQDLDSQPLRIEPVVPAELIQTACEMIVQRAASANIKLRTECPPDLDPFSGDFIRLAQALHQLLDNACKFSPADSTITIATQATPDTLLISITDQGIGISPDEHSRIFDRFYQVDGGMNRRHAGTGLGLAIVKESIEAHRGQVEVESEQGVGSTFTVQLPVGKTNSWE